MASTGTLTTTCPQVSFTTSSANIGLMNQTNTISQTFTIVVSSSATYGQVADFTNLVGDAIYFDSKLFSLTIGLKSEDFESNTFTEYAWNNSSASSWITTAENPYEGTHCSKSGIIADMANTDLSIELNVIAAGEISFMKKVSSEVDYDFLTFSIDGILKGEWSGELDWSAETYPVTTGTHTFTWSYKKDQSAFDGADAAWIDYILFPSFESSTSINENLLNSMNIFPNPVKDELMVTFGEQSSMAVFTINVRDIQGRIVHTSSSITAGKSVINTSNFSNGMYVIEATNGVSSIQRKVVKQ
jgi:hypothetical protein